MALERIGLGATLTADSTQMVNAMGKARDEFGRFVTAGNRVPPTLNNIGMASQRAMQQMSAGVSKISKGIGQFNSGLRSATFAALPLTVAVGAGVAKAAAFEKQMSAVGAITRANEQDMTMLTKKAKQMGITSVFSATQSAQAMEFMARAGASATQITAGLSGVMNAAAADSIDLATSADIVSQVVKGMGKSFDEANNIADILALTSARSNTNIINLGESFKYGAAQARAMGVPIEETAAIFGKLADAGLRGSLGGTALTNMLIKMAKPSKEGKKILDEFGVKLTTADGKMRKISAVVDDFSKELNKIPDAAQRAAKATEVFGVRGQRGFFALAAAGAEATNKLERELLASSFGIGAAAEAAEKRLDNFLGALTLFSSSVESVSIGLFSPLLKAFTPVVQEITDGLNSILFSLEGLDDIRNKERRLNAESAQVIGELTARRLEDAGASKQQTLATQSAMMVLSRSQISTENLSRAQVEARKRGVLAAFEQAQREKEAEALANAARAAGVKSVEDLSENRKKVVLSGLKKQFEVEKETIGKQIDLALSGAKGAAAAREALKERTLQLALETSAGLSAEQRKQLATTLAADASIMVGLEQREDSIRAQIHTIERLQEIEEKHGKGAVSIAQGIQDAIDTLKNGWDRLVQSVRNFGDALRQQLGDEGLRRLTKIITVITLITAAVVPVLIALATVGFFISGLTTAFAALWTIASGVFTFMSGAAGMLMAALWPITLVLGAVGLAFALIRRENETVMQTVTRVWEGIKAKVIEVWVGVIQPFIEGFRLAWQVLTADIKEAWDNTIGSVIQVFTEVIADIKSHIQEISAAWGFGTDAMTVDWVEMGKTVANFVAAMVIAVIETIGFLVKTATKVMGVLFKVLTMPFQAFDNFLGLTFDGIIDLMEGNFLTGLAKIGVAIFDVLTTPIRMALKGVLELAKLIPGVESKIPQGLQKFADEGLQGFTFPKPEQQKKTAVEVAQKGAEAAATTAPTQPQVAAEQDRKSQLATLKEQLKGITDLKVQEKQRQQEAPKVQVQADLTDKRTLNINNKMCVDGESLNVASARHKQEIQDRAGFRATPWQRRVMLEQGAAPVTASATG